MRRRDVKAPFIGAAVALLVTGGIAWAAIPGDGGVIQACFDNRGNVKVVAALPCPKGYTALPPIYTKAGADAAFLTPAAADATYLGKTELAADSNKLDGMDSSEFMPLTNCIGYPHGDIDWHGCDLHFANLNDARLFGANLHGANFFVAGLIQADLRGADLRDADLRRANLFGASLFAADLTGADLTGTTLIDANLTDANLTGVTWGNTFCPDGTNSDDNGGTCVGHL